MTQSDLWASKDAALTDLIWTVRRGCRAGRWYSSSESFVDFDRHNSVFKTRCRQSWILSHFENADLPSCSVLTEIP